MKDEQDYFAKIRRLTLALILSGALNIAIGGFFFYWVLQERPPTPYCELQPATRIHQLPPLSDQRSISDIVALYRKLTFEQLSGKLYNTQLVEDGYSQRDIALAALKTFHYFDLHRALQSEAQPNEERPLICRKSKSDECINLTVYPGLTDRQFQAIIHFAYTERWPITGQGLFLLLQREDLSKEPSLAESFYLTPEFSAIETLFARSEVPVEKPELLAMIIDGDWETLDEFTKQQRISQDLSPSRREKLLLDYIEKGSKGAAYVILKTDATFAGKKLDDKHVLAILQLLKDKTSESELFAQSLLTSPRSLGVCQQAAFRLYEYSGKLIPDPWNYESALATFAPQRLLIEKVQKAVAAEAPIKMLNTLLPKAPEKAIPEKGTIVFSTSKQTRVPTRVPNPNLNPKPDVKQKPIAQSDPKPKPNTPAITKERLYVVQEGDSLWKISRKFNVDMEVIKKQNGLKSDALKPGLTLRIPQN